MRKLAAVGKGQGDGCTIDEYLTPGGLRDDHVDEDEGRERRTREGMTGQKQRGKRESQETGISCSKPILLASSPLPLISVGSPDLPTYLPLLH